MELTFEEFRKYNERISKKQVVIRIIPKLSEGQIKRIRKNAKKLIEKIRAHNRKMMLSEERAKSFDYRVR